MKAVRDVRGFIRLLNHKNPDVQYEAAIALGMIGELAVEPLVLALKEGDGNLRWGAPIALGKIKDMRTTEPLIRALADKYENVRAEAAAALAAIGTPTIVPLISFLKYQGSAVRIEVMNTLGNLQAAEAFEPLIQMLEKANEDERRAIAGILDSILTPTAEAYAKRI